MRDLGSLEIDRVILHYIPPRRSDSIEVPILSEDVSQLGTTTLFYFRRKLVSTLTNSAYPVLFDSTTTSIIPGLVQRVLYFGTQDFIKDSQTIANHLYQSQPGSSPQGMLAVADSSLGGFRAFAIVKLEHEEGTRATLVKRSGGQVFDMEHLRDLLLTSKTRVFKAGLFIHDPSTAQPSIDGYVSDNQAAQWAKSAIADYFLRRFLGCELREDPAVSTQNFLAQAEHWFNTAIIDPVKQASYTVALLTEMRRNQDTINPGAFAREYLELEDRQAFVDHLDASGVPTIAFPKDTNLVDSRLKNVSMRMESGLMILGSVEAFDSKVNVRNADNGQAEVTITDRVQNLRGRG